MQLNMWDEPPFPERPVPVRWGYRRKAVIVGSTEFLAEDKVGRHLGWNLPVVRGTVASTAGGGSGAYRLLGPTSFLADPDAAFEVLRVSRWKRFGNSVRQMANLFHVARRYGAVRIEFPAPHALFAGPRTGTATIAWTPPVQLSPALAGLLPERPGLMGDFFSIRSLGLVPSPADQARVLVEDLRPLIVPEVARVNVEVLESDLVLHFRGGDVFGSDGPDRVNQRYGQPPLAYYLAAVARERPRRVWLVYEDRSNPAVDAAEAALRRQGIEVRSQSASLAEDLNVLLNARTLIASFGSFCLATAALSVRLRKLYLFGPPVATHLQLGIRTTEAIDIPGDYRGAATSDNWRATSEQLKLMVSYPQHAIGFREHGPITG